MKQFCNKKRQREKENDQSFDEFILSNNKKEKKSQILVPQDNNININLIDNNKLDKYSNSTLQSKNDFLFETKKEEIFKIINYNNKENKIENNVLLEDYFPFEIGEIIQNKYEVIIYNI